MLNAGFRFICCHPDEDDDEYGNVNWRKNLLEKLPLEEMEMLRGRQAIAMPQARPTQDSSFDLATGGNAKQAPTKHKRFRSLGTHTVELAISNRVQIVHRDEVIRYLNKAKQQGAEVLEMILSEKALV